MAHNRKAGSNQRLDYLALQSHPSGSEAAIKADHTLTVSVVTDLFQSSSKDLQRFIAKKFGIGPPEPEDVVNAAFQRIAGFKAKKPIDNPKALLWRIAQNIAISERRSMAVEKRYSQDVGEIFSLREGDDLTPERVLIGRQKVMLIKEHLSKMPVRRREIVIMNRIHGLSFAEIARRTGLSQTAVKKHMAKAMLDLDTVLSDT